MRVYTPGRGPDGVGVRFEVYEPSAHRLADSDLTQLGLPRGLESGALPDANITVSSVFVDSSNPGAPSAGAGSARLNVTQGAGAWCAGTARAGEWIQIEVDPALETGGLAIQGREAFGQFGSLWVTTFEVQHSMNGNSWTAVEEQGGRTPRIFRGNLDGRTIVQHAFTNPIRARFVRLVVSGWFGFPCLRAELYGTAADARRAEERAIAEREAARRRAEDEARARAEAQARAEAARRQAEEDRKRAEVELARNVTGEAKTRAEALLNDANSRVDALAREQAKAKEDLAAAAAASATRQDAAATAAASAQKRLDSLLFMHARRRQTEQRLVSARQELAGLEVSDAKQQRAREASRAGILQLDRGIAAFMSYLKMISGDFDDGSFAINNGTSNATASAAETSAANGGRAPGGSSNGDASANGSGGGNGTSSLEQPFATAALRANETGNATSRHTGKTNTGSEATDNPDAWPMPVYNPGKENPDLDVPSARKPPPVWETAGAAAAGAAAGAAATPAAAAANSSQAASSSASESADSAATSEAEARHRAATRKATDEARAAAAAAAAAAAEAAAAAAKKLESDRVNGPDLWPNPPFMPGQEPRAFAVPFETKEGVVGTGGVGVEDAGDTPKGEQEGESTSSGSGSGSEAQKTQQNVPRVIVTKKPDGRLEYTPVEVPPKDFP